MSSGRKVEYVSPPAATAGRDLGKRYRITEVDSVVAEKWGIRIVLALTRGGLQLPQNVHGLGLLGLGIVALNTLFRGNVEWSEIEPLFDEMMQCVEIVRDPAGSPMYAVPMISPNDIEEVPTRLWLRSEVIRIHTGFSAADAFSALSLAIMTSADSSTTPTSPPGSDTSSVAERRRFTS